MPLSELDKILIGKDQRLRYNNLHTHRVIQAVEVRPNELIEFLWACIDHADIARDFDVSVSLYKRITCITLETNQEELRQYKRRCNDRIREYQLRFHNL